MPVCRVEPSAMNGRACSAIAASTSRRLGVGRRERRRVALDEHVDLVEVQSVAVVGRQPEGAREALRWPRRRAARSGSAPARRSSSTVPPACSERLHQPSSSGGAATVAMTRGACCSSERLEAPEVGRGKADVGALVAQGPLDRAEEAARGSARAGG